MSRRLWALLLVLAGCKSNAIPAGGAIVLAISATQPVDRVWLRVFDRRIDKGEYTFNTNGRDLSKQAEVYQITPGMLIAGGDVLFVGEAYVGTGTAAIASGRAIATFQPNESGKVTLILTPGIIDVDQDGYAKDEECDDNNSLRTPFFDEICGDNIDNNCDGTIDEQCPCTQNGSRACYSFDPATRGLGACQDGAQACTNGKWDVCNGSVGPEAESCDGKDHNCNGSVDESCPCTGTLRYCNNRQVSKVDGAPTDLMLHGTCEAGVQDCTNKVWGLCIGAVLPTGETCNGFDDDCDSVIDNGLDKDGDGYTPCGTISGNCGAASGVTGISGALIDCDDGDPTRHPCQPQKCGIGDKDDNCSGVPNDCTTALGQCATDYYAGWLSSGGGRLKDSCYAAGNPYGTQCDPNTLLCMLEDVQCPQNPGVGAAVRQRPVCSDVSGCDAGTKNPPVVGSALSGSDPYNDCPAIACDGSGGQKIYSGLGGGTQTGWDLNGNTFECRVWGNVPAAQTNCVGGACETPVTACQSAKVTSVVSFSSSAGCQVPSGYVSGTNNYGVSCFTASGSTTSVDPQLIAIADGQPDPLNRCLGDPSQCVGFVELSWSPAGSCEVITVGNPPNALCQGGACGTSSVLSSCTPAATGLVTCASPTCTIASACVPGSFIAPPGSRCYNANGGITAVGGANGCLADSVCAATGGVDTDATCLPCIYDTACGGEGSNPSCASCGAGTCGTGIAGGAVSAPTGGTRGSNAACMCPAPGSGDNSAHMWCNGVCCGSGKVCNVSNVCTTTALVPCGPNTTCNPTTQYCDVSKDVFVCASQLPAANGVFACGQTTCPANDYCLDFAKSDCSMCSGAPGSATACDGNCCSGGNVCNTTTWACETTNVSPTNCGPSGFNCSNATDGRTCTDVNGDAYPFGPNGANSVSCFTGLCGGTTRCGAASFCNSGSCAACTTGANCGSLCNACPGSEACMAPGGTAACATGAGCTCNNCNQTATCGSPANSCTAGTPACGATAAVTSCASYSCIAACSATDTCCGRDCVSCGAKHCTGGAGCGAFCQ